jgi:ABC-type sugar transport system permease subunit
VVEYRAVELHLLASLRALSTEVFEAARIDGAGVFSTFFSVTLPS